MSSPVSSAAIPRPRGNLAVIKQMPPPSDEAEAWVDRMERVAQRGVSPAVATMTLAEYGELEWNLAWPCAAWIPRPWTLTAPGGACVNPARVSGWQRAYQQVEDELDDPRSPALRDRDALDALATALVERSHEHFFGWGDVVRFAARIAAVGVDPMARLFTGPRGGRITTAILRTPPTGTRSSSASATNTCAATTSGIPG
ncbi:MULTISPECIES: hypothetical protein [Streptomyces]|uniref:hypothetical protein n=1 Tax=Streptomyces TaxID=1883 RepID=UPI00345BDD1D